MTTNRDSSVLFALDELRQHERVRAEQESESRRQRAELARRQADVAAKRRLEAERNAEELVRLRKQADAAALDRAALESQLLSLRAAKRLQEPIPITPPAAPSVVEINTGTPHHLLWTAALLFSCLGVFVLTYSPDASPPPPETPMPVMVASADCPVAPPPIEESLPAPAGDVAEKPAPTPKENTRKQTRRRRGNATAESKGNKDVIVLDDCNGPLCHLPD